MGEIPMMLIFVFLLAFFQSSDKKDQPLVSATDPAFLSCAVWTGKQWTKPMARSARTPVFRSSKGLSAYGEVQVVVHGSDCENTTTLHVSRSPQAEFKIVYTKNMTDSDGNGIRLVGWSPDGSKLLAEVTSWKYETDSSFDFAPVIYDVSADSAKEQSALGKSLLLYFGSSCEFDYSVRNWETDQQIRIRISPTPESREYEQHFCVDHPKLFVYDLLKDKLQPIQPVHGVAK
jgi:hypothetical protein